MFTLLHLLLGISFNFNIAVRLKIKRKKKNKFRWGRRIGVQIHPVPLF